MRPASCQIPKRSGSRPPALELETVNRPRNAFFSQFEDVNAQNAIGRIAAEQITPYPPGTLVIVPGERITEEVVDYLLSGLAAGMVLPDPADPSLNTIRAINGRSSAVVLGGVSLSMTPTSRSNGPRTWICHRLRREPLTKLFHTLLGAFPGLPDRQPTQLLRFCTCVGGVRWRSVRSEFAATRMTLSP
jgi:hypothetical protein